ncbi:GntR family transcriptional regulator [Xanthobacter sp. KR7-65]|uniref:GntR family transcriptional regulator n=1 Tax=Xanthobacter sp. KR7-65 TaxID=3156612 RepID=UPI0032B320C0
MAAEVADEVKQSLGYQAFDRIKNDIVWCRLNPGEEVSEARLCELYGLGKAPIRQALSRLVQEGYVLSVPRRGHFIAPVTLQSVKDLFELRLLLEPASVEGACGRADAARLNQLNAECARGYRPGDEASEGAFMAANRAFHLEIARASGNARLAKVLAQVIDEMTRLLHLGFVLRERPEEMTHEHQDLVDAIIAGDKDRARTIAIEHIRSVRALVVDGIVTHTNLSNITIVPN